MNVPTKIALAVGGGYLLGRQRKAKLAVGLGLWLVGRRLADFDPKKLLQGLGRELAATPQVAGLRDELRTTVRTAGRAASDALLNQGIGRLADGLHQRTEGLRQLAGAVPGGAGERGGQRG
ncbi:hypothetical protein [Goodfellowiella coeruleoviolacea]|uniref:Uncharacterized protein n=1 Tax=Goodfellowiella coeruleoviolacea TaxID=334858 RepID=A0AAE3KI32_9PSEU|nr:hypothetical protein [Goodfellowiella coeruleoviolacea]MCP2168050.1 hypothetical protein [Goodfellowiella coeruleoviolacea]